MLGLKVKNELSMSEEAQSSAKLPVTGKCLDCMNSFLIIKLRYCKTCAIDDGHTVVSLGDSLNTDAINEILKNVYCQECSFSHHVDCGHNTIPIHKFDAQMSQMESARDNMRNLLPKIREAISTHTASNVEMRKLNTLMNLLATNSAKISSASATDLMVTLDSHKELFSQMKETAAQQLERLKVVHSTVQKAVDQNKGDAFSHSLLNEHAETVSVYSDFYRCKDLNTRDSLWNQGGQKADAIAFQVSHNVLLSGVGIYGARKNTTCNVTLSILRHTDNEHIQLVKLTAKVVSSGFTLVHRIILPKPISLTANETYEVMILVKGISDPNVRSYSLSEAVKRVRLGALYHFLPQVVGTVGNSTVTVQFKSSTLSKNGTDDDSGQIPLLCFSTLDGSVSTQTINDVVQIESVESPNCTVHVSADSDSLISSSDSSDEADPSF